MLTNHSNSTCFLNPIKDIGNSQKNVKIHKSNELKSVMANNLRGNEMLKHVIILVSVNDLNQLIRIVKTLAAYSPITDCESSARCVAQANLIIIVIIRLVLINAPSFNIRRLLTILLINDYQGGVFCNVVQS